MIKIKIRKSFSENLNPAEFKSFRIVTEVETEALIDNDINSKTSKSIINEESNKLFHLVKKLNDADMKTLIELLENSS